MDEASKQVVVDALLIAADYGKIGADRKAQLAKKVEGDGLGDSDREFVSTILKLCLRVAYNEASKKSGGADRYGMTAKKLEIEILNRALDAIKAEAAAPKGCALRAVAIAPALPSAGAAKVGYMSLGWVSVVLGVVSLIMLAYAIYVVRKTKKKAREEV